MGKPCLNITFHLTSDRTQIGREAVVKELCNAYDKLAKEYWRNDNLYYMEKSLEYYNKIHKLIYYVWPSYSQFRLYYYLYKAYNESSSSRTFNLEQVKDNKEFEQVNAQTPTFQRYSMREQTKEMLSETKVEDRQAFTRSIGKVLREKISSLFQFQR